MSAFPHIDQMLTPGVTPEMLKKHPYKKWTVEEVRYLEGLESAAGTQENSVVQTEPEALVSAPVDVLARYRDAAHAAIARGEKRILPIVVGGKNPAIVWKNSSMDLTSAADWTDDKAREWVELAGQEAIKAKGAQEFNACVVAKPDESIFIDCDTYREFVAGYEAFAGEKFPVTYTTSARENRTQIHFRQTDATRALGNVPQFKSGDVDLSVRQHNQYVIAEGSIHAKTETPYVAIVGGSAVPMPDKLVEYIRQLQAAVLKKASVSTSASTSSDGEWVSAEQKLAALPRNSDGRIPHGFLHPAMLIVAGYWRAKGLDAPDIEEKLKDYGNENFQFPVDWKKVKEMSVSICNFPAGENKDIALNQTATAPASAPASDMSADAAQTDGVVEKDSITYAVVAYGNQVRHVPLDTREAHARPKFPTWVIEGTSIGENLVKPAIETSGKYPELIFMPAVQLMMNFLSRKVYVELQPTDMNLFVGLISPFGQFFKSSSCKLGQDYMAAAGICKKYSKNTTNADGLTLVGQAGSPEGFGIQMQRVNCTHAILFFDELGKLVSKTGIEGSGFASDLLTWYGGEDFGNTVSSVKSNFSFHAGTYTFGWLWCTTDRNFNHYWPKLAGIASGIGDRMFFVVAPEKPRESKFYRDPSFGEGPLQTRKLIDRAIVQNKFQLEDAERFAERIKGMDPRSIDLAVKLSLYFAIDLGLSVVDDDCAERACALVAYRNQAAAFLEPIEAENSEGRLMKEILRELRQNKGRISYRELCRSLDFGRFGKTWGVAYGLLRSHGEIVEFQERRTKGKRATHMVGLVRHWEDFEEDEPEANAAD